MRYLHNYVWLYIEPGVAPCLEGCRLNARMVLPTVQPLSNAVSLWRNTLMTTSTLSGMRLASASMSSRNDTQESDVWCCNMMHSGLCSKHDALRRDRSQSLCTWSPLPPTQPSSPSHSLARLKQDHKVFFQIRIPCEPSCSFWFTANRGPASHHFCLLLGQPGSAWSWLIWAFSIETAAVCFNWKCPN